LRLLRALARLAALALAANAVLLLTIVWPAMPAPTSADAVVLLSGDGARLPATLRLMEEGVAPTLVFVGLPDTQPVADLCEVNQPFEVVCLRPSPDHTRTEAEATGELARSRGWKTLVVSTSKLHATRARMLFRRCFAGHVQVIGDYPHYGWRFLRHGIAHEWLGLVHATVVARAC